MKNLTQHIYNCSSPLLLAICLLTTFTGCTREFLEAKPDKNLAVPATLQDFQGLMDNLRIVTQNSPVSGEIASDGHYVTDVFYQNSTKGYNTDAYIWSKTVRHEDKGASTWQQPFQRILYCNIVLDGITKMESSGANELSEFNNVKGQALFQRARSFFEFSQIYAPPYNESTASSDLGIVMRLSSDITLRSRRSSVKETFDQILGDLLIAKDLMPDLPTVPTRASKSAALALLARVYLVIENYEKAYDYANQALQIYDALLDYNEVLPSANFIGRYNPEVIFHANYVNGFLTSNCLIEQSLYDTYDDYDLRKTRFYRVNASTGAISFKGNYEGTTANLFCGLATDELYLIRAECHARAGRTIEAMNDLNTLLKKRWDKNVSYPTMTATDAEDALRKVLDERKKELILRNIRWSDLRRLNKDPRFAVTLKRTVLGVEYTLEPNSYKYTFPIPDDILQQTGIQPNPGWE